MELLQRYLKQIAQVDEAEIRTKKDIFRESAKRKIIMDAEKWINYYEARNITSHTYDFDRAAYVFQVAQNLPPDVDDLIKTLKEAS
jgi:Nucleotidyltransferase substrate binding protein like.